MPASDGTQNARGFFPGRSRDEIRWTQASPPADATDPNPHVPARFCKFGAETPHTLALATRPVWTRGHVKAARPFISPKGLRQKHLRGG